MINWLRLLRLQLSSAYYKNRREGGMELGKWEWPGWDYFGLPCEKLLVMSVSTFEPSWSMLNLSFWWFWSSPLEFVTFPGWIEELSACEVRQLRSPWFISVSCCFSRVFTWLKDLFLERQNKTQSKTYIRTIFSIIITCMLNTARFLAAIFFTVASILIQSCIKSGGKN